MTQTIHIPSDLGIISVTSSALGICSVIIENQIKNSSEAGPLLPILQDAVAQLREYLDGKRKVFEVTLDWTGIVGFQKDVLTITSSIPYGEVRTYGQIAQLLGKPAASRATGGALARNPLLILIPCHRVISASRELTGYAGGFSVKQRLLELEGHTVVGQKLA